MTEDSGLRKNVTNVNAWPIGAHDDSRGSALEGEPANDVRRCQMLEIEVEVEAMLNMNE